MAEKELYTWNERELLERIAEGDETAFATFFRHYYPLLAQVVSIYALSEMDREDILHETFIRVWLSRDRLPEVEQPDAWLCRIASRECFRIMEKNGRKKQKEWLSAEARASSLTGPEEQLQANELNLLIHQAIELLPAQRRRIYIMSRAAGMKPADIASELALSVSTVKNSLVTALKDIRAYLDAAGYEMPWTLLMPVVIYYFN